MCTLQYKNVFLPIADFLVDKKNCSNFDQTYSLHYQEHWQFD